MRRYRDRAEGARALAAALAEHAGAPDLLLLAIPRGGVPIACDVASALGVPFDVLVVRRITVPHRPDLTLGAVASGGVRILDSSLARKVPRVLLEGEIAREEAELVRRDRALRGHGHPPPDLRGKRVILVDDGLLTGSTMQAAVRAVRRQGSTAVLVAAPVGSKEAVELLRTEGTDVVCPRTVSTLVSLSQAYEDFIPIADAEVRGLLEHARGERGGRQERPLH